MSAPLYNPQTSSSFTVNGDTLNFNGIGGFQKEVPVSVLNDFVSNQQGFIQNTQDRLASQTPQSIEQQYNELVRQGKADKFGTLQDFQNSRQYFRDNSQNSINKWDFVNSPVDQWNKSQNSLAAQQIANIGGFRNELDQSGADYLRKIQGGGGGFGGFLKRAAPLALGAGAAIFGAPMISSALSGVGAGATGVAAGGAASSGLSGLGSSLLSGFNASTALSGALTGGLGGLASGGDFGSALKGAAFGGLGGGFGSSIAGGLGLSTVPSQAAFTGALTGAAGGLGSGNLRDAGLGALLGAGGGYLSAGGGIPGLGNAQGASLDATTGVAGMQGATQGSGILSNLTKSTGTGLTIGGQPMKLGSLLGAAGDIYGYAQGRSDIDDIQDMLTQQSAKAQAQFQPYAQAGQDALGQLQGGYDAFTQDPGYQFRLEQGNQALERSLAARGLGQSGAALKAAQEYGQGLADQSYNDFFNRQSSIAGQGLGAASGLGSLYTNLGNVQAAAQLQQINDRNDLLSSLGGRLGGIFG